MKRARPVSLSSKPITDQLYLALVLFGLLSSLAQLSRAQTNQATAQAPSRFGIRAELSTSSNFKPFESADHTGEANLLLVPSLKISEELKATVRGSVTKDLENEQELKLGDSRVGVSHTGLVLSPTLTLSPAVAAVLPTSEKSYKGDGMLFGLRAAGQLKADLSRNEGFLGKLEPSYSLVVVRSFHEFPTSVSGDSNTMLSINNSLSLAYSLTEVAKLNLMASRALGLTYDFSPKNNYELEQSVSYDLNSAWSISAGHNNSGTAFKENGKDSNISVFDGSNSVFFVSLTFNQ